MFCFLGKNTHTGTCRATDEIPDVRRLDVPNLHMTRHDPHCLFPLPIHFEWGMIGSYLTSPFSSRKAATGLWLEEPLKHKPFWTGVCVLKRRFCRRHPFFCDSPCPRAWRGVKPRCLGGSALLCIPDRSDPGSDRLGLWGEAESRRCFDPAALLYVVYLQVLAPAEGKKIKQGCLFLAFPDRNQKLTILGLKAPQPDNVGPVGLPRTDWSLTIA